MNTLLPLNNSKKDLTMQTEDDTFKALTRSPFNEVNSKVLSNYHANRNNSTGINALDIIRKHGWTTKEYNKYTSKTMPNHC